MPPLSLQWTLGAIIRAIWQLEAETSVEVSRRVGVHPSHYRLKALEGHGYAVGARVQHEVRLA